MKILSTIFRKLLLWLVGLLEPQDEPSRKRQSGQRGKRFTYTAVNQWLTGVKKALVCLCLIIVALTSCCNQRTASEALNRIVQLQLVVQEVAEGVPVQQNNDADYQYEDEGY